MALDFSATYDDASKKEDLWDVISNIDPTETWLSSNLGQVDVTNIRHEWLVDTLTAQTAAAGVIEGADTTYAFTNPTRAANYTQIIEKGFKVSGTQQAVDHAGFANRFAYEQEKKLKEWKNQLEFSVLRGTLATGDGTTARYMKGIKGFASTLATTPSGVSLSENMVNAYLDNAWAQGATIDTILVGAVLKNRINGFTAGITKNIDATEYKQVKRVDVLDTTNGLVRVIRHRYMTISGDTNYDLMGIQSDMCKIGFLRKPHFEERSKTGDATKGAIIGEATVQVGTELAVMTALKVL